MQEELNNERKAGLTDFEEVVSEAAKLPEQKLKNLCFFINGFVTGATTSETTETKEKAAG